MTSLPTIRNHRGIKPHCKYHLRGSSSKYLSNNLVTDKICLEISSPRGWDKAEEGQCEEGQKFLFHV